MRKERDSNFELLRIICIFLIVMSHCILHSCANSREILEPVQLNLNHFFSIMVGTWGRLAVEIFVILSSWFLVDGYGIHSKKIVKIVAQTWFWCIVLLCIGLVLNLDVISTKVIIKELLTPIYPQYWFVTNYVIFYMIVPFLQVFVKSIDKKRLGLLCCIFSILVVAYKLTEGVSNIIYFIYLFILTAWIKDNEGWFKKYSNLLSIFCYIVLVILKILAKDADLLFDISLGDKAILLINAVQMLLTTIFAFSLVNCFARIKIKYNRIINIIASTTLGVYVIHENIIMRGESNQVSMLWDSIFGVGNAYSESKGYIGITILSVVVTCVLCSIIELVRIKIMDSCVIDKMKWLDKICNKVDKLYL